MKVMATSISNACWTYDSLF